MSSSLRDEIKECFQFVSVNPEDKILERCEELCHKYHLNAEDFVDQWCAYTATHLQGAPPNLETLEQLERRELAHSKNKNLNSKLTLKEDVQGFLGESGEAEGLVSRKPQIPLQKDSTALVKNVHPNFSQPHSHKNNSTMLVSMEVTDSEEQVETPTQRYTQRDDSRSIQCQFNDCIRENNSTLKSPAGNVKITLLNKVSQTKGTLLAHRVATRAKMLNHITNFLAQDIARSYGLQLTQRTVRECGPTEPISVAGRIYLDPKQNVVWLETTMDINNGLRLKLNLQEFPKFAVFNGQIVVVTGRLQNDVFLVQQLYVGPQLSFPADVPQLAQGSLQIVIAAGPFTLPDNLQYQPLLDLIKFVKDSRPHVLILMGPFLDSNHQQIKDLSVCYDEYFEQLVHEFLLVQLEDCPETKVVLVPSNRDVHHFSPYPALPYPVALSNERFVLSSDPSMLDMNGVVIGLTSADVLFHLNKKEHFVDKFHRMSNDKMARLASHVLNQRCFYPLHPPDQDVKIDFELLVKYGLMHVTPHILVLPSNFKNFVKVVDGCVVVNPERLTKGNVGGTFARLEVRPVDDSNRNDPFCKRINCQILRI